MRAHRCTFGGVCGVACVCTVDGCHGERCGGMVSRSTRFCCLDTILTRRHGMVYLPVSLLTKVGLNASNITTSDSIIVTSVVLTQLVTQLVTQSPVLGYIF